MLKVDLHIDQLKLETLAWSKFDIIGHFIGQSQVNTKALSIPKDLKSLIGIERTWLDSSGSMVDVGSMASTFLNSPLAERKWK